MNTRAHRSSGGFTLLELLVVIGIIALLATIAIPSLRGFTAVNVVQQGNRQLLDDINLARNYAQAQRSTVYMVFVPAMESLQLQGLAIPTDPKRRDEAQQITNLLSGQYSAYNFVTLRTPGDQPGRGHARYLSEWKHLPDGVFIPADKLFPLSAVEWEKKRSNGETNLPMTQLTVPFPLSTSTNKLAMPCIAFDFRGQLVGPVPGTPRRIDEVITLARGSIVLSRDANGKLTMVLPETIETPKGNSTNNPHVRIDWITGRARIEEPTL